jgi:hypothetical protein
VNRGAAHTRLVNAILGELGAMPGVVIGVNPCGLARYMSTQGKHFAVPYGWPSPGGPDILAVVAPHGRMVAIECKTGGGIARSIQKDVHAALCAVGVTVCVVGSVEEALEVIQDVLTSMLVRA